MDVKDGNNRNNDCLHWIVQDTNDQGLPPFAQSSFIKQQAIGAACAVS